MENGAVRILARLVAASVVTLLTILFVVPAAADNAKAGSTLAIIVEKGSGAKLATAIAAELPTSWTSADPKAIAAAATKRELPESLSELDSPVTKGPYLNRLARVAADVGAEASVAVQVSKGKNRQARVVLVSARGGTRLDTQVALGAPADDAAQIAHAFSGELAAIAQDAPAPKPEAGPAAAAAPAPAAAPAAGAPKAEASKPVAPAADTGPAPPPPATSGSSEPGPIVVGTVAMELASRHLSFRDAVTALHSDDSGLAPTPAIAVEVFPGARSGVAYLQDLGLFGDFKYGIVQDKHLAADNRASITWTRFDAGLKYRLWVRPAGRALMLAPSLSYGQESYLFGEATGSTAALDTPSVAYKMVRPRLDVRMPIGPIAVLAGGGYLAILSSGKVASAFHDSTVLGWEADVGLTVPIGNTFELRGGAAYRRISYWFSPVVGDKNVANGAHDQLLRADLGVSARF
jgi:hypothetical protein